MTLTEGLLCGVCVDVLRKREWICAVCVERWMSVVLRVWMCCVDICVVWMRFI